MTNQDDTTEPDVYARLRHSIEIGLDAIEKVAHSHHMSLVSVEFEGDNLYAPRPKRFTFVDRENATFIGYNRPYQ
jgi:hypothetical protein